MGSAIGFLKAPFGYESLASRLVGLSDFEVDGVNAMLADLRETAEKFVRAGTDAPIKRDITAFMRYGGQGWEIPVTLPDRALTQADVALLRDGFTSNYARFFGRAIDGLDGLEIEIVTWSIKASDEVAKQKPISVRTTGSTISSPEMRDVFDPARGSRVPSAIVSRANLKPGDKVLGPAIIVEDETSTIVTSPFDAVIQSEGSILLTRKGA